MNNDIYKEVTVENNVYSVILHPSKDSGYWVECPELDCNSQGDTIEEALMMITDCIEGYLDVLQNLPCNI